MSMRKLIRASMRGQAERRGAKPSKWVSVEFDRYQIKKYGATKRAINKGRGTRKRSKWKEAIAYELLKAEQTKKISAKRAR